MGLLPGRSQFPVYHWRAMEAARPAQISGPTESGITRDCGGCSVRRKRCAPAFVDAAGHDDELLLYRAGFDWSYLPDKDPLRFTCCPGGFDVGCRCGDF